MRLRVLNTPACRNNKRQGLRPAMPCLRLGDDVFFTVHLQPLDVLYGALAICAERAIVVVDLGVVILYAPIVQRFRRTFACALRRDVGILRIMHPCLCESFPLKREWRTALRAMGQAVPPLIAFTASGAFGGYPIEDHREELTVLD